MAVKIPPIPRTDSPKEWEMYRNAIRNSLIKYNSIAWPIIDFTESTLADIQIRTHSLLQSILGADLSDTDASENKHISNVYGKGWEDHRLATGNPHGATTSDISEGSNLYYLNERVDDRVSALIQDGNALVWTYNDAGGTLTGDVTKATASADASSSAVSVTNPDADLTYSQNEVDLMNELKADLNQLVTDMNAVVISLNELKANLRTSGILTV